MSNASATTAQFLDISFPRWRGEVLCSLGPGVSAPSSPLAECGNVLGVPVLDPLVEQYDYDWLVREGYISGKPDKKWRTGRTFGIALHCHTFDNMCLQRRGRAFWITNGILYIAKGTEWDGSTGVRDTFYDILASLVHDLLCYALVELYYTIGTLPRYWWPRIVADWIYARIQRRQGENWIRSYGRFLGLRALGRPFTFFNEGSKLFRRKRKNRHAG